VSRTSNIEITNTETTEDVLSLFAEQNRRAGTPLGIEIATRCEEAIVSNRILVEERDLMIQYMRDNGLQWPPPDGWTPGWANSELDDVEPDGIEDVEPGSFEPDE
jgi:hypothetical protein